MPTFDYNLDNPNAPNAPSRDQPRMKVNTNSINSIIDVDHYTFESSGSRDGWHKQVTMPSQNVPGAQVNPASTLYTENGMASATVSNLKYRNSDGIFLGSAIRAFVNFDTVVGSPVAITRNNYSNVDSLTKPTTQSVEIALTPGAIANTVTPLVFINSSNGGDSISWSYAGDSIFLQSTNLNTAGRTVSVLVIQA